MMCTTPRSAPASRRSAADSSKERPMKLRADEITSVIQREIEQFQSQVTRTEVGRVLEVGDGIARVHGLAGVMNGEMVTFENGVKGLALNLEETSVGVIILGDYTQIHE